ncbi:MAG: LptF/LptG family permease [Candidatus Riflebacteria bacterium]|nr:LptF/LptG family permease [Candidatus Riflebacteria bacterium]
MIKTIDKYIFNQLIGPFFFGFFMFVTVIAIDPLMFALQNIVNDNIPAGIVIKWFLFRLPQDMIFTFPMSMLLASLLVFGRMSKDSETIALRAGGINFLRLLLPVMFFAVMITVVSFVFDELVVPDANKRAQEIRRNDIMRVVEPEASENVIMRISDGGFAYARKVFEAKNSMEKVLIEYYQDGKISRRLSASEALWNGQEWGLTGIVEQLYEDGKVSTSKSYQKMDLKGVKETPADFARQSKRPNEMSYRELKDRIDTYDRTKFMDTTELQVELAMKTSLPFACIFFALIGASFGMTSYRSGAFIGFGVSIVIIFVYYVLMSTSTAMGKSGLLPVMLSAWLQNIVFAVAGIFIASRVNA